MPDDEFVVGERGRDSAKQDQVVAAGEVGRAFVEIEGAHAGGGRVHRDAGLLQEFLGRLRVGCEFRRTDHEIDVNRHAVDHVWSAKRPPPSRRATVPIPGLLLNATARRSGCMTAIGTSGGSRDRPRAQICLSSSSANAEPKVFWMSRKLFSCRTTRKGRLRSPSCSTIRLSGSGGPCDRAARCARHAHSANRGSTAVCAECQHQCRRSLRSDRRRRRGRANSQDSGIRR